MQIENKTTNLNLFHLFKLLPQEILSEIYTFDGTFRDKFNNEVIPMINKLFKKSQHQYKVDKMRQRKSKVAILRNIVIDFYYNQHQ